MNMTTFWLFIVCSIFFIIGIIGAVYYCNKVNAWDKCPSTSEYMECLLIGWCSCMLIILAGVSSLITFVALVLNL